MRSSSYSKPNEYENQEKKIFSMNYNNFDYLLKLISKLFTDINLMFRLIHIDVLHVMFFLRKILSCLFELRQKNSFYLNPS